MKDRIDLSRKRLGQYIIRQKAFWNVNDEPSAKFKRILLGEEESEIAWQTSAAKSLQHLLVGIAPKTEWIILEIGCGVGRLINELRKKIMFRRFIGVDISENMISFARKNFNEDERLEFKVNNGYDLSMLDDGCINFAYAVDVFIHIYDVDIVSSYLNEVRRVLKDGGILRFNVRSFDPEVAFSNSIGGRFARWMYRVGLWSSGTHRWNPDEDAEFNGNTYMLHEIKKLIKQSRLLLSEINVDGLQYWCTVRKSTEICQDNRRL